MNIPDELDEFVNDCKIHVFEVAWFSDEQIAKFTSDFKVVANFFAKKRRNKNYMPNDTTEIKHVDETLKLLRVMTGDARYEKVMSSEEGKVKNMCEVAERLENIGRTEGEDRLGTLISKLMAEGRMDDVKNAASDKAARDELYKEFGI